MLRFRCAALAAVALVGLASVASAADMPVKAPLAPAVAADLWTGWYFGASAGARWNKDTWTATGFQIPADPFDLTSRDNPHDFTSSSARFGLYGGYNWRVQQMWVVGLEADFAWASNKSSSAGIPGLNAIFTPSDTVQMKDTWDGGVRGRLGYLITPTMLLFGTGGVSWMKSEASVTCGTSPSLCSGTNNTSHRTDSVSKTVVGWTLGAGLEAVVIPNWLLRGEYRYSSYAGYHATLLQGGGAGGPGSNVDVVDADIKNRTQTILVGLAYKFGQ